MGNPVVRFEIGVADDQALTRFGELFGWRLQAVADGYTMVDAMERAGALGFGVYCHGPH